MKGNAMIVNSERFSVIVPDIPSTRCRPDGSEFMLDQFHFIGRDIFYRTDDELQRRSAQLKEAINLTDQNGFHDDPRMRNDNYSMLHAQFKEQLRIVQNEMERRNIPT